jgi:integrase
MQSQFESQPQSQSDSGPQSQSHEERLFLNSYSSNYTRTNYKIHLDAYLKIIGDKDLSALLSKTPREIENDLIEFIISLKERGCKRSTISNYVKPVIGVCSVNDITLNNAKINRFIPPNVRNKKTRPYTIREIQKLLDIADERMRSVILLASSSGLRSGAIPGLNIGSCESMPGHDDLDSKVHCRS